jgi:hypothetical protein
MLMRFFTRTLLGSLLMLIFLVSSVQAQMLPLNLSLDSSFGIEYLLGRQDLRHVSPQNVATFKEFNNQWDPQMAVLSGVVEVTPFPFASGRLGGSVSVASSVREVARDRGVLPDFFLWNLRSAYNAWEAAGLYHLWNQDGYRFSAVGGYRRETWLYKGDSDTPLSPNATLREEFVANIPFIGLQTAMHFPWWKARFEVLGSWFVKKTFHQSVNQNNAIEVRDGRGDQGGIMIFQMEGTGHVTPNILFGLQGRYSYQNFIGPSLVTSTYSGAPASGYKAYYNESIGSFGVNLTLVF